MSDFLAMGGYAGYVWSAYLITLVAFIANIVAARSRLKQIRRQIVSRMKREERNP